MKKQEALKTNHSVYFNDARCLSDIGDDIIDLVVTSPPYPMIEMWDGIFGEMNDEIGAYLNDGKGKEAFERMHRELDNVWKELFRVVKQGGFVCINIGDATRTVGGRFQLYNNHSRIIQSCHHLGFDTLPMVLWRKTTNAPNKFMGSGMLPSGAYVTLEHEYILVMRKGTKKTFKTNIDKQKRSESAFFWEERNKWFSDLWDLVGVSQTLTGSQNRTRSAAYPFELSYRLINMYSVKGDTVFDPFAGTGTTMLSAMAAGRNSINFEIDPSFTSLLLSEKASYIPELNKRIERRIREHRSFITKYEAKKGPSKYRNNFFGFPVVTKQEISMKIERVETIEKNEPNGFAVSYGNFVHSMDLFES